MSDRPLPRILARIRATKEEEITALLEAVPEAELGRRARATLSADPPRAFHRAVTAPPRRGPLNLIAEIKKASPSKGLIREDFDPAAIARAYAEGGAAALSCLTDRAYFQGDGAALAAAREAAGLPVLRKDFLLHPAQVLEARILGADAVLLIARLLSAERLEELLALARELAMATLTEVHDEADVEKALRAEAPLVGVNNRDLDTFTVDPATTARLRSLLPATLPVVAESGIFTPADARAMADAGACAMLVGEGLMRHEDLVSATRNLLG